MPWYSLSLVIKTIITNTNQKSWLESSYRRSRQRQSQNQRWAGDLVSWCRPQVQISWLHRITAQLLYCCDATADRLTLYRCARSHEWTLSSHDKPTSHTHYRLVDSQLPHDHIHSGLISILNELSFVPLCCSFSTYFLYARIRFAFTSGDFMLIGSVK